MNLLLTRRHLLRQAAACAAVAAVPSLCLAEENAPPIVDTHQHLWDLSRFRLPWLGKGDDVLNRTHTVGDYLKAAEGLNVVKAVYMEVAVAPEQRVEEAEYVIDLCRRRAGPTVAAVIAGAPERDDFARYIGQFEGSAYVKGVRSDFGSAIGKSEFQKNLRLLGEAGLSYDINAGPPLLEVAATVAEKTPGTRFVLDHCGNIDAALFGKRELSSAEREVRDAWERGVSRLAERKNVVCKISGVMEAARGGGAGPDEYAAVINYCLDRFGADRVMFASNWPVVNRGGSFYKWVEVVREVTRGRTKTARRKLFHDNAMHFYGLQ